MPTTNQLLDAFEGGQPVFGGDARTFSPAMIEAFGNLGLEYVWLDYEHSGPSPYDSHTTETYCRTASDAGTELVVRVPEASPKLIGKLLDAGVRTIVVPQIETAAELETAVNAARYCGDGTRGTGPGRTSEWGYGSGGSLEETDESILVGAMIETEAAVENVRDILSVPNLGFLFVGPSDLSLSMTGEVDKNADEVQAAVADVLDAAAEADVPVGRSFYDADAAQAALEDGYSMITLGRDVTEACSSLEGRLDAVR